MGRGIRDVGDYCAVLVLTSDAALTLGDPQLRNFYSPATRAQIELSQQLADQIRGEGVGALADLLDVFLGRKREWVSRSLEATADVTYESSGNVSPIAAGRREAFNRAVAGDPDGAVLVLRAAIDTVDDPLLKGWYLEELAAYEHHVNALASQKTLAAARRLNPAVLKPAVSPSRKKLSGPAVQGQAASQYLGANYRESRTLELAVASLFDNIVWGVEEAADRSEEQFRLLGLHLGFGSTRPEKEDRDGGPDNLWALTSSRYLVIEMKTDVSRKNPVIIKSEAEQLTHSMTWFGERYPEVSAPVAILVHPTVELDELAHLPSGTRIMTKASLEELRADVQGLVKNLSDTGKWADAGEVTSALEEYGLTAERFLSRYTEKSRR